MCNGVHSTAESPYIVYTVPTFTFPLFIVFPVLFLMFPVYIFHIFIFPLAHVFHILFFYFLLMLLDIFAIHFSAATL